MSSDRPDELRFGQAMERLEGILRRIEEEEIDIDELGQLSLSVRNTAGQTVYRLDLSPR